MNIVRTWKLKTLLSILILITTAEAVVALPNLTPYQPSGWSDKIVVARTTGTTTDSTGLTTADTLYVNWAVINNGTTAATSTFYTYLYVDGVYKTYWTTASLNANSYTYANDTSIGSLSAGTHTITITTDATGAIAESNESDNSYTKTITVSSPSLPNLTPYQPSGWSDKIVVARTTGTTTDSTGLTTADTLYVNWAVINNGSAAANGTFYTYLYVDGAYKTSWNTASLSAGSYTYANNTSIGSLSAGTHTITITTDATGTIAESNEGDNSYTKTITVSTPSLPNLTPYQPPGWSDAIIVSRTASSTTDSTSLTTADTLYVNAAVINNGAAATAINFQNALFVDGVEATYWVTVAPLDVNSYSYLTTGYSIGQLSAGTHTIKVTADYGGVIAESNEGDNSYTKTITVSNPPQPNLTPYQPSGWSDKIIVSRTASSTTDSTSLTTADTLYVNAAVINNGAAATAINFQNAIYVDGVEQTYWVTAAPLNIGYYSYMTTGYSIGSLSAGTHSIEVIADNGGVIAESNEGDNSYTKTITVSTANLPAPTLNSPSDGSTGQTTTPAFSWSPVTGASSYRIMVATIAADLPSDPTATNGGPSVVTNTTTTTTSFTPGIPLNMGATYYWEVHARSVTQYGTWSSVNSFTTVNPVPNIRIEPLQLTFNASPPASPAGVTLSQQAATLVPKLLLGSSASPEVKTPDFYRKASEFRALQLRDENGQIAPNALIRAYEEKRKMLRSVNAAPLVPGLTSGENPAIAGIQPNAWTWLGPGNIGGRIRSILIDPSDPNTMWLGGVDGGVWKTVNAGASWFPLDDFMANLAVSCMVMDPANHNVIYVGTGEGYNNQDAIQGAGIFKTTDGGSTWAQLSSTATSFFYYVNRLSINPANNQIILAATRSGIYRSTDGGVSWSQRYGSQTYDVSFDPVDGTKCVASGSGFVLYSTDGGVSWQSATGISGAGRIEIAYAASSPNIVYASADKNLGELYRSTDGGQTYNIRNTGSDYFVDPFGDPEQGWYDNAVWVDPTNPNLVIIGGEDIWRSTDGGATLTDIGGYSGSIHADQHSIVSIPTYNGTTVRTVFIGNDGGIFRATDISTATSSSGWTGLNNNLGITQFYGGAGNSSSGVIVGGTQDNGTLRYTSAGGTGYWTSMAGGDGGFCAADSTDANFFYGEQSDLRIVRSINGGVWSSSIYTGITDAGSSANFIAPFILDPNNPNTMVAGGDNLWRSTNVKAATPSWSSIKAGTGSPISAIAIASGNSDMIWVGYNNGDVYATVNGTAASPTWTEKDLGAPNLPNRYCERITIDPTDPNRVYVTFGGFDSDNVWRTTDGGSTWANISGNLPSAPVYSLVISPSDNNSLYVGTEVGMFASADGGANWSTSNDGPANVAVDELFWVGSELVAATHGRGMFSVTPNSVNANTFTIFNDGNANLNVSSISTETSAPWISWTPAAPFIVTPGASRSVSVSIDFNKAPAGQATTRLLVASSDATKSPYPGGVFIQVNNQTTDTQGPTLTITLPTDGAIVTSASLPVSGTASDNGYGDNGVSSVTVNGVAANNDTATGSGTANWSSTVTLLSGVNAITVVAKDMLNNSTQKVVNVTYNPPQPVFGGSSVGSGKLQTTLSGLSTGESVVTEASTDLRTWTPVQTNSVNGSSMTVTNSITPSAKIQFFRTRVQ